MIFWMERGTFSYFLHASYMVLCIRVKFFCFMIDQLLDLGEFRALVELDGEISTLKDELGLGDLEHVVRALPVPSPYRRLSVVASIGANLESEHGIVQLDHIGANARGAGVGRTYLTLATASCDDIVTAGRRRGAAKLGARILAGHVQSVQGSHVTFLLHEV